MNPYSRYTAYETAAASFSAQRKRQLKKSKLWAQKHDEYKVYYYGSNQEKELKNLLTRKTLKEQIAQIQTSNKTFVAKAEESRIAGELDRMWKTEDLEQKRKQKEILTRYRDDNKKIIEQNAQRKRAEIQAQKREESKLLSLNPINWSQSLT